VDVKNYVLVFDDVIVRQLRKLSTNKHLRDILTNILDRLEEYGPNAGKILDSRFQIYEVKLKHPPIRLYYRYNFITKEIYVFEFEMKTSDTKQQRTIDRIREKLDS